MRTWLRSAALVAAFLLPSLAAAARSVAELRSVEVMQRAKSSATVLPGRATESVPSRTLTRAQVARIVSNSVAPSGRGQIGTRAPSAGEKTLANGLFFSGNFSYQVSGSTVTLAVDKVTNTSTTLTTGTLRLELWASTTEPARGVGFTGYRLAISPNIDPLPVNSFYSSLFYTTSFTPPPDGTYWMVFVLSEFDSLNCTASDHFCIEDSGVFPTQATFGVTSGLLTIISQAGDQCYQNYPAAAFSVVQQLMPGFFQSYSSAVTCASLGMGIYAGTLANDTSVPVYTSSSSTAELLCAGGLITGCTVLPPTGPSYTDLWWNPAESGWGISLTHHPSGTIFVAWYTYDTSGNPKWYVSPSCPVVNSACTGALYQTHGPAFGGTFNPSLVTAQQVGTISLQFVSPSFATMTYSVNGISGIEFIVRQSF